jgi:hypothetical protein
MKTIQETVAEKLAEKAPNVAGMVADKLVDVEIQKRIDIMTKSINKQDSLEKDLKKIDKDDITSYTGGQQVTSMSKVRYDEIKKLKEKISKLVGSINSALEQNSKDSYTKLEETLKKIDNAGNTKADSTEEGAE